MNDDAHPPFVVVPTRKLLSVPKRATSALLILNVSGVLVPVPKSATFAVASVYKNALVVGVADVPPDPIFITAYCPVVWVMFLTVLLPKRLMTFPFRPPVTPVVPIRKLLLASRRAVSEPLRLKIKGFAAVVPSVWLDAVTAGAVTVPVNVGEALNTVLPVPVLVVTPVPPLRTGKAVPDKVIAKVPLVVMGEPATDKKVGTDAATEVTVPCGFAAVVIVVTRP
jgi:hypothetical protein